MKVRSTVQSLRIGFFFFAMAVVIGATTTAHAKCNFDLSSLDAALGGFANKTPQGATNTSVPTDLSAFVPKDLNAAVPSGLSAPQTSQFDFSALFSWLKPI